MDKLKIDSCIKKLGFKIMRYAKLNENGPDLYISKDGIPFSVEIKSCKITKRNSVQVPPVEKNRLKDDFIAIVHPTGYVLFEPMDHHLKCCTEKGYRTLWK